MRNLRLVLHLLLFVLAAFAFTIGLGIGLQQNQTVGTTLVVLALIIVGLNIWWSVSLFRVKSP